MATMFEKNIFKDLFIENCLEQGLSFKQIIELYKTSLKQFKCLTEKEILNKRNSFYKYLWTKHKDKV